MSGCIFKAVMLSVQTCEFIFCDMKKGDLKYRIKNPGTLLYLKAEEDR